MIGGVFKDKISQGAQENLGASPPATAGWIVSTADVVQRDAKNPYYQSLLGVSTIELEQIIQSETVKTGFSVITNLPGASKSSRAHLDPKVTDLNLTGTTSKLSDTSVSLQPGEVFSAEMIHVGSHFVSPTVVGTNRRDLPAVTAVNATPMDTNVAEGAIAKGAVTGASLGAGGNTKPAPAPDPNRDEKGRIMTLPLTSPAKAKLPADIDPKTGKQTPVDDSHGKNYQGGNLLTGTVLMSPTALLLSVTTFEGGIF